MNVRCSSSGCWNARDPIHDDVAWLRQHEVALVRVGALALCHGTPDHDDRYLAKRLTEHAVVQRESEPLARELHAIKADIVFADTVTYRGSWVCRTVDWW